MSDLISRAETAEYLKSVLLEAARLSVGKEAELFANLANKAVDEWMNAVPAVDTAPMVMVDTELIDEELMEKIRKAPIVLKPNVDAAPVVHGQWIDEDPDLYLNPRMRCSVCGHVEMPLVGWNYCPNCGAKMDKEG